MTEDELIATHQYIESLNIDETSKEVCRGAMLGRYWAITLQKQGIDITQINTTELVDLIAKMQGSTNQNLSA